MTDQKPEEVQEVVNETAEECREFVRSLPAKWNTKELVSHVAGSDGLTQDEKILLLRCLTVVRVLHAQRLLNDLEDAKVTP